MKRVTDLCERVEGIGAGLWDLLQMDAGSNNYHTT
jgi:hypothetical protein